MAWHGLDISVLGHEQVAGCCEYSNEPFPKMQGISWLAEKLVASQGLCSMEWVNEWVSKGVYMCHIPHYIVQRFGYWQFNNIISTDVIVSLSHIFSYGSDFSEQSKSGHNLCKNLKVKGKVHPCTGTEALYRLYGP